jgi:hypothetical protein
MKPLESYRPAELAHGPMFIGFLFNVALYGELRVYPVAQPKLRVFQAL